MASFFALVLFRVLWPPQTAGLVMHVERDGLNNLDGGSLCYVLHVVACEVLSSGKVRRSKSTCRRWPSPCSRRQLTNRGSSADIGTSGDMLCQAFLQNRREPPGLMFDSSEPSREGEKVVYCCNFSGFPRVRASEQQAMALI